MIRGGGSFLEYTTISETEMEVMEMLANENSPILGVALSEIDLPTGSLVGVLITKNKGVILPSGNTTISAGDKVIIVSMPENIAQLEELIEGAVRN